MDGGYKKILSIFPGQHFQELGYHLLKPQQNNEVDTAKQKAHMSQEAVILPKRGVVLIEFCSLWAIQKSVLNTCLSEENRPFKTMGLEGYEK